MVLIKPLSIFMTTLIACLVHSQFTKQQATQGELNGFVEVQYISAVRKSSSRHSAAKLTQGRLIMMQTFAQSV